MKYKSFTTSAFLEKTEYTIRVDAVNNTPQFYIYLSKEMYDICKTLNNSRINELLEKCIFINFKELENRQQQLFDKHIHATFPPTFSTQSGSFATGDRWILSPSGTTSITIAELQQRQYNIIAQLQEEEAKRALVQQMFERDK